MELSHGNPLYFPKAAIPSCPRGSRQVRDSLILLRPQCLEGMFGYAGAGKDSLFLAQLLTVAAFPQRRARLRKTLYIRKCSLGKEFHP